MTCCKYTENRNMAVTYSSNPDLSQIGRGGFHILLIKRGAVHFLINDTYCFTNSRSILVLSNLGKYKFIRSFGLEAELISFAPEFINVNLNWETVESVGYPALCLKHYYPDFQLFLLTDAYFGVLNLSSGQCSETEKTFSNMREQLQDQPDQRWSCRTRSYLFKLMARLKFMRNEYLGNESPDELPVKVCNYILSHLDGDLSVEFLCKQFATNHTTLFNQFTGYTGIPVSVYVAQKRLESAKSDLAFTSLALTEIAAMNGFCNSSYFTRAFKQVFGITPLKYRQTAREKRPDKALP